MLNFIWAAMMITAIVFGLCSGRVAETTTALMTGAQDAVEMTVSLAGVLCFWTGIMNVAKEAGLTKIISRVMEPVIRLLFPKLRDEEAKDAIIMNMTANMLGMSNAATPLGIKAMEKLARHSNGNRATDEMCMFVVINTASLQIIPSTLIAMRQAAGSAYPTQIILPVWLAGACALFVGVMCAKMFSAVRHD